MTREAAAKSIGPGLRPSEGGRGLLDRLWRRPYALVAALAILPYLNALPNGFAYDDVPIVQTNPIFAPSEPLWRAWTRPYWPDSEKGEEQDLLYRPLTIQTYAIERRLFGPSPLPCHFFNIVLHALTSLCAFALAQRTLANRPLALLSAALFAIHPIHTEAVANVVGRAEILAALGMALALIAEQRRLERSPRVALAASATNRWIAPPWLWSIAVGICTFTAATAKESGLTTVGVLAVWHVYLRVNGRRKTENGRAFDDGSSKRPWGRGAILVRSLAVSLLPALLASALYLFLRYEACGDRILLGAQRAGPGNPLRDAESLTLFLTPLSILGRYLALTLWPAILLCDYSTRAIPPTTSLVEPYLLLFLGFAAACVVTKPRAVDPLALKFALAAFLATFALTMNLFIHIDVLMAERLYYAPSLWAFPAFVVLCHEAWHGVAARLPKERRQPYLLAALLVAFTGLIGRTLARNPDWSSTDGLIRHDVALLPPGRRSAHLVDQMARILYLEGKDLAAAGRAEEARGRFDSAESLLHEAMEMVPLYPNYPSHLGEVRLARGDAKGAVEALEKALAMAPRNVTTTELLQQAKLLSRGLDPAAAYAAVLEDLKIHPTDAKLLKQRVELAEALSPEEAVQAARDWATAFPESVEARRVLAATLMKLNKAENANEAAAIFEQLLRENPGDCESHANLALCLMDRSAGPRYRPKEAIAHARRAVDLAPTDWRLRINLAEVLAHCGAETEAAALFEELARQSSDATEAALFRERARYLRGIGGG